MIANDPLPNAADALGSTQQADPQPQAAPAPVPEHHDKLSQILHAVGDVLGGPKTTPVADSEGNVNQQPVSTGSRVAHGVGTALATFGTAMSAAGGKQPHNYVQDIQNNQQTQQENAVQQAKLTQDQMAGKATIAFHNNQMLMWQHDRQRMDEEQRVKMTENAQAWELKVQELGLQKPPIMVNGEDVNGKEGNDKAMMEYFTDPKNHQAPSGMTAMYLPSVDENGKIGHAVYLMPQDMMKQTVSTKREDFVKMTGVNPPGTGDVTTTAGQLLGLSNAYTQSLNQQHLEKKNKVEADNAQKNQTAEQNLKSAETNRANAEANKANAEATAASTENLDQLKGPDALGFTPSLPVGTPKEVVKEYNKRQDTFKKNADNLSKTDATYQQFNAIMGDINSGKGMTGAQSVVGLFDAVGMSAESLSGKGFRVNRDVLHEHIKARGDLTGFFAWWLGHSNGDIITPGQLKDYAAIAAQTRHSEYVNLINQVHNAGLSANFVLPRGNNAAIDPNTASIYFETSEGKTPQEKAANARRAAQQMGWQVGQ